MCIKLNGSDLTICDAVKVSRFGEKVEIDEIAKANIKKSREYVEKKLREGSVIYGLTTGFGKFSDKAISREDTKALQKNLIISHACGMGNFLPTETVRAAMLLRCNALSKGFSGIRLETIETLVEMLNRGVHPLIPEKGSLGASGDLAPLSHIMLVVIGEGEAEYKGEILPGGKAMKKAGIPTIELEAKEGLALINGTQIMTAIGCLVVYDAMDLMKTADIAAAMTSEALFGIKKAFDSKVHGVRPHPGQSASARNLLKLLNGSGLAQDKIDGKVQDAYSIRCTPQVHGASRDAINYAEKVIETEMNSVTDNPIIFPDEDESISGGNFHGQPVGLAMDFLGIALSEFADISERRIERLVNPHLSEGLPGFLTRNGGVNSGFMIAQYSAASMVSENKVYAHPACVDSIPSSGNQEDHVSMGTTAARKARMILDNTQKVIGIELLAAAQGLYFRGEEKMAPATRAAYDHIRKSVAPIEDDVVMYPYLATLDGMVKNHEITDSVKNICADIE